MRIKHFFGLAVLAAMTASCSSNNDLVNGGNGNGEITNEATVGYAAFNINLPSVNGTRAADAGVLAGRGAVRSTADRDVPGVSGRQLCAGGSADGGERANQQGHKKAGIKIKDA